MDAISNLLENCAGLKAGEKTLILVDSETADVGEAVKEKAADKGRVTLVELPAMNMHGQEPDEKIAQLMMGHELIVCLTKKSLAHSKARFNATEKGNRYLSLPDYSVELLQHKALSFDFSLLQKESEAIAAKLSNGVQCRVTSELGTDLIFDLNGRTANSCPGLARGNGELASPPDAEVNIAPLESGTHGVLVVDGSIPCDEIGVLDSPLTLTLKNGMISSFDGPKSEVLKDIFDKTGNQNSKILGELGIGLNPYADLCGIMLVDEGCRGTVHFGFGSNNTIGGLNSAPMHLDMVITKPTLHIDGEAVIIDGSICQL